MESATTNPQGCSITRTSITLPLITKPFWAKLANKRCKLYLWLHYLLQYFAVICPLAIISSFMVTARLKNSQIKLSVSNFRVRQPMQNEEEKGRSLSGDREALFNL